MLRILQHQLDLPIAVGAACDEVADVIWYRHLGQAVKHIYDILGPIPPILPHTDCVALIHIREGSSAAIEVRRSWSGNPVRGLTAVKSSP